MIRIRLVHITDKSGQQPFFNILRLIYIRKEGLAAESDRRRRQVHRRQLLRRRQSPVLVPETEGVTAGAGEWGPGQGGDLEDAPVPDAPARVKGVDASVGCVGAWLQKRSESRESGGSSSFSASAGGPQAAARRSRQGRWRLW